MELAIKGKVEEWRYDRRNTYLIISVFAKQSASAEQLMPLPYDDELEIEMDELEKLYWSSTVPYN